jgi:hopene-associated glycosyltransferase HpnB
VGLWLAHSRFWAVELPEDAPAPERWPSVVAVIPARNEAPVIGETIESLLAQRYPGPLRLLVVDDDSEDGTAAAARLASGDAVTVLAAPPLPPGWTGKVWAMSQGVEAAGRTFPPEFVLFSDADIHHGEGVLRRLVARAQRDGLDMASLMVRLRCRSLAERLTIPAFVFFFRLLYPFRRVNDPRHPLAGAAGGTMLVRWSALDRIGGMGSIRGEIIDDCALAARVKAGGHGIRLDLSDSSFSTRGYGALREVMGMIARTAYTQLGYSPLRLLACTAGLALAFGAPPLLTLTADGPARILGGAAWLLMAALYAPMVRFYGLGLPWAPLLPVTAGIYLAATVQSAWRHHRGRGGQWKGRNQSGAAPTSPA